MVAANVNWWAAVPVGAYGALLLAMDSGRKTGGLRRLVSVVTFTISLHSLYAATAYFRPGSDGLVIGPTIPSVSMQAFARSVTNYSWAQFADITKSKERRLPLSHHATDVPALHVVLVLDESVEADRLSVNGYQLGARAVGHRLRHALGMAVPGMKNHDYFRHVGAF